MTTNAMEKRGRQIDKVYELWRKAYDAFSMSGVTLCTAAATRHLKRLRDYLNKEFPDEAVRNKGRENSVAD